MATAEQDTIQLLNIFPQEVWQMVLDNVTDCTAFQNLRHSSPFFASLTDPLRQQVLFSGVVDKLCSYFPKSERNNDTILICRLVCQAWKNGVDNFMENIEPHLKFSPNDPYEKIPKHIYFSLLPKTFNSTLLYDNDPQLFHSYFSKSHSFSNGDPNPFVGRSISIKLYDDGDPQFAEYLIPVLERWGHHVWFVYFRIRHSTDHYELFSRFMEYLPNLKLVSVWVYNDNRTSNEIPVSANISVFQHYPQLQCIKTFDLPEFVWDKLKERNLHVAQVDVVSPAQCRILRIEEYGEREIARIQRSARNPTRQQMREQMEEALEARRRRDRKIEEIKRFQNIRLY